jgi:hypothetical protein
MNRRDFLAASGAGLAWAGFAGRISAAGLDDAIVMHIIRIQFAQGISPELRDREIASINRFKQIHVPEEYIVGRDLAQAGDTQYDWTQVSLFNSEEAYHDYFYAPIHLAADREAYDSKDKPFASIGSFDTVRGDSGLPARLTKIGADRTAKFKANDTRPTSPPVPDRPEDLKWNHGRSIYRVVRLNLSSMSEDQKKARLDAMEKCKKIQGVEQVYYGANVQRSPDDHYTHAMFIALAGEDAYKNYLASPLHDEERKAGGQLARENVSHFDVIDPNNSALADRLRKLHADTGM